MYSNFRHSMPFFFQRWKVGSFGSRVFPTWPLRTWALLHSHLPLSYLHRAEATRKQRRRCHGVPGLEILIDCTHKSTCKSFLKVVLCQNLCHFISVHLHKETYEYVWKEIVQILFTQVDCKHHLEPNQNASSTVNKTTNSLYALHLHNPQNMSPVSKVSGSIGESLSKKHWDTKVSVDGCSEFPSRSSKTTMSSWKVTWNWNFLQKHSFVWLLG